MALCSCIGTGCPVKWCCHHSWRYLSTWRHLKDVQMWPLRTWFSCGLGRAALMVKDLKCLFQPKLFYDLLVALQSFIMRLEIVCSSHGAANNRIWADMGKKPFLGFLGSVSLFYLSTILFKHMAPNPWPLSGCCGTTWDQNPGCRQHQK